MTEENEENGFKPHHEYTKEYLNFINKFASQYEKSITTKNGLKIAYFVIIAIMMVVLIGVFFLTTVGAAVLFFIMIVKDYKSVEIMTGAVVSIISSLATMIVTIFKLPDIIANYLFNKDEDDSVTKFIGSIQNYEIRAVEFEQNLKQTKVRAEEDKSNKESDYELDARTVNNNFPSDEIREA